MFLFHLINKKVETSSKNEEIDSVLYESLECSPHSSNGKGGPPDPQRESSSSMGGGPSDPNQNIFLPMGGPPDPCGNSIDREFQQNFHSSKIELDLEAFENHVTTQGHNLRDDSSYSSSESHAFEHNDLSSYDRIDVIIASASKELDRLTDEILCLDLKEQGSHLHPSLTCEHEDTFEHVLVKLLPQLDMKPCFFEEKRKPESNHLPLKKRFVWKGSSATTRTNHATPTPECATHELLLTSKNLVRNA